MTANWHNTSLRIGLLSVALVLFAVALDDWVRGEAFCDPSALVLSFLIVLCGLGMLALALLRSIPTYTSWLILVGMLFSVLLSAFLAHRTYAPLTANRTDDEMVVQFAVKSLEHGENPYVWDYTDITRVFREQGVDIYHASFLDGAFRARVTYPAMPIILYSLVNWLGVDLGQGGISAIGLFALTILLILLFLGTPQPLRPVILVPMFIFREFLSWSLNGVQDVVWSMLLVGMIYVWKRPLWRALLYGLACSFSQQPWFVAPFLLMCLWLCEGGTRRERFQRIVLFASLSFSVFVAINLPFFLWDPKAWTSGVLEPFSARLNYLSHGFAILSEYGIAPFPRAFYTMTQVSAYVILLVLYWFYAPAIRQGFWIFPGMFFWFCYRSLPSYWAYWIPAMLLAAAGGATRVFTGELNWHRPRGRWQSRIPVILVTSIVVVNLGWAITLLRRESLISVSYTPPIEIFHTGLANRLHVTVRNRSQRILTPRFFVQPDYGVQFLPWHILSGPERLRPNETGEYLIDAKTLPSRGFKVARGGLLVVTDAGGDYALRALLDIPAQTYYEEVDLIANPDFLYWPQDGPAPTEWILAPSQGVTAHTHLQPLEGHTALLVEATGIPTSTLAVTRLHQTVTFPDRFTIWVYRTSSSMNPTEHVYGLEFDDGEHRLWVLFGESEQQGTFGSDNHRYIYRRALLNVWTLQTIDLHTIYDQFEWQKPIPSLRISRGIRYTVPQVKLSLIVGDRDADLARWVFGQIQQTKYSTEPDAPVDYAIEHPASYYVSVGDKYRSQRNYNLAEDAYTKALAYDSVNGEAYFGLGEAHFWLGNYTQARDAFQNALNLMHPNEGAAHKGIGWSEYNLGNYHDSIWEFEQAVRAFSAREDPDDTLSLADAYNGLGWSWLQLDGCSRAYAYFDQALDLVPMMTGATDGLSRCITD